MLFGLVTGAIDLCRLLRRVMDPIQARYAMPVAVLIKGLLPTALVASLAPGPTLPFAVAVATLAGHLLTSGRTYIIWLLLGASAGLGLWGLAIALFGLGLAALYIDNETVLAWTGPALGVAMVLSPQWYAEDIEVLWAFVVLSASILYLARGFLRRHRTTISKLRPVAMIMVAFLIMFVAHHVRVGRQGFGGETACELLVSGSPTANMVAITFDDGPDPEYTPEILRVLREANVKATFFLVGRKVLAYPEIARQIVAEGHIVGNHSYSHNDLGKLSRIALAAEIDWTQRAITEVCGVTPLLFRPPRGVTSPVLLELLADRGLVLSLWTMSSQDWLQLTPGGIASSITRRAVAGDVFLFHDSGDFVSSSGASRDATVLALPRVIDGLAKKGLAMVGLDTVLATAREEGWCESIRLAELRKMQSEQSAASLLAQSKAWAWFLQAGR